MIDRFARDLELDFLRKFESIRQRTEYSFFYENVELPTNCISDR